MSENTKEKLSTIRWNVLKMPESEHKDAVMEILESMMGYPAPGPEGPEGPEGENPSIDPFKLAVVIGHTANSQGARMASPHSGSEWNFNKAVARHIVKMAPPGMEVKNFFRSPDLKYKEQIKSVYESVSKWEPDLTLELHFNSGGGNYTSMLVRDGQAESARIGLFMAAAVAEGLGIQDFKTMPRGGGDRGFLSCQHAPQPFVLTEPFFGDCPEHVEAIRQLGPAGLAGFYLDGIAAAFAFPERYSKPR